MAKKKVYRTNKGKTIDMEAMRVANERTIASGNMKVNAKGDEVKGGKVVKTAKERVKPYYKNKQTQIARTSVKPKLKESDKKVNLSKAAVEDEKKDEPKITLRTRDDGSQYNEILYPDGTMEVEEVAAEPKKKKTSKKKKTPPSSSI